MKRRIAVRAIIVHEGKLLCVKLKPYNITADVLSTGEFWCTVGGGLEPVEELIAGLQREIIEETGIKPVVGGLLYVHQFVTPETDTEHVEFMFHVTNTSDFMNIDLSKTSHGNIEIAEISFVDVTKEVVLPVFLQKETFENLAAAQTKFFNYL